MENPLPTIEAAEQEAFEALEITDSSIATTEKLIVKLQGVLEMLKEKRKRQAATARALTHDLARCSQLLQQPLQQELFPDQFPPEQDY